ncbi:hypothetical protein CEUSTIGMA_g435.t1 [Chlamydomonas eustigma]|uniref:Uncharacterized protein n=1 Tax=Chlamydomonas eustigma TaxID=1157962 RepID=A0A250WQ87_9CHLO|nr:hypothetical protein CEUSTIGMA_g435.t1 [Chlamydomonas eustigma]|eukprot:GAX72983.1 hypothetical protein CEUSTIGMA_g435.t1 [Chlamydomonas eustigma]
MKSRHKNFQTAIGSTEDAISPSTAAVKAAKKVKLLPRYLGICWERYELRMLQKEMELSEDGEEGDADWDLPAEAMDSSATASASYFAHWDNPSAHLHYLNDKMLCSAFKQAIAANAEFMRDKVVLDLGCGLGHLSMICAQAGARHVYAVDGSEGAATAAKQVILSNGLSDRVTVIYGDVEAGLRLKEPVDVIVSDCLGPMLLGGGMLRALAIAKRTLLKPGGIVLPDIADLYVAGIDDRDHLSTCKQQWESVAGFDMSAAMSQVVRHARLDTLTRSSQLFTTSHRLLRLGMGTTTAVRSPLEYSEEASSSTVPLTPRLAALDGFTAPFQLEALREERLFALMLWFEASFSFDDQAVQPVAVFSCSPTETSTTHQQQLILNFPKSIRLGKGEILEGTISWRPDTEFDAKRVVVEVEVNYKGVTATAAYNLPAIMTSHDR